MATLSKHLPSKPTSRSTARATSRPQAETEAPISWQTSLVVLLSALVGSAAALLLLPLFVSDVTAQHAPWHLARSSGVIAYFMLWTSTALGLGITNRLARLWPGGPLAFDLHQFTSLLGLAAALFHALILLGDSYIGYSLTQIALPFAAQGYKPLSTAWGQIGLYLGAIVSFSFYVRQYIGRKAWRALHFASFLVFGLVTVHGVLAGSDTPALWPLYAASILSILFLTIYRIFATVK